MNRAAHAAPRIRECNGRHNQTTLPMRERTDAYGKTAAAPSSLPPWIIKSTRDRTYCTVICFGVCLTVSIFGMCTVKMPSLLSQRIASAFAFSGSEKLRSKLP
jgi:hypothetical protein